MDTLFKFGFFDISRIESRFSPHRRVESAGFFVISRSESWFARHSKVSNAIFFDKSRLVSLL